MLWSEEQQEAGSSAAFSRLSLDRLRLSSRALYQKIRLWVFQETRMLGRSTRHTARERIALDGILAPTTARTSRVRTATRGRTVQVSLTQQPSPWLDIT